MTRRIGGKAVISRMFAIAAMLVLGTGQAAGADPDLAAHCARAHDDDTVHGYVVALHDGLVTAFERLFPSASRPPDDHEIQAGAHIRCMDGHLLACFTGANLPCSKMNVAPDNRGADAFCRDNPDAPAVPAFAAGHDTIYQYRCVSGRADVTGTLLELDRRGFAARLWTPLD